MLEGLMRSEKESMEDRFRSLKVFKADLECQSPRETRQKDCSGKSTASRGDLRKWRCCDEMPPLVIHRASTTDYRVLGTPKQGPAGTGDAAMNYYR